MGAVEFVPDVAPDQIYAVFAGLVSGTGPGAYSVTGTPDVLYLGSWEGCVTFVADAGVHQPAVVAWDSERVAQARQAPATGKPEPHVPAEVLLTGVRATLHRHHAWLVGRMNGTHKRAEIINFGTRAAAVADCCELLGIDRPDSSEGFQP